MTKLPRYVATLPCCHFFQPYDYRPKMRFSKTNDGHCVVRCYLSFAVENNNISGEMHNI